MRYFISLGLFVDKRAIAHPFAIALASGARPTDEDISDSLGAVMVSVAGTIELSEPNYREFLSSHPGCRELSKADYESYTGEKE